MDYTELVSTIIAVIVAIVSIFVIPLIKKHISSASLANILQYVEIFVTAAEQIFDIAQGEEKKMYVLQRLEEMNFHIDPEILDAQIEAAVLRLHAELRSTVD